MTANNTPIFGLSALRTGSSIEWSVTQGDSAVEFENAITDDTAILLAQAIDSIFGNNEAEGRVRVEIHASKEARLEEARALLAEAEAEVADEAGVLEELGVIEKPKRRTARRAPSRKKAEPAEETPTPVEEAEVVAEDIEVQEVVEETPAPVEEFEEVEEAEEETSQDEEEDEGDDDFGSDDEAPVAPRASAPSAPETDEDDDNF